MSFEKFKVPAKPVRAQVHALYEGDIPFKAYARYIQSLWRMDKNLPHRQYGNILADEQGAMDAIFITPQIAELAQTKYPEMPKSFLNLLSSKVLVYNVFGAIAGDLNKAQKLLSELLHPVDQILRIEFDFAPFAEGGVARSDHAQFDVFVEYQLGTQKGFWGFQFKYTESLKEESKGKAERSHKIQYDETADASGLFKKDRMNDLRLPPFSAIWRDHLLALDVKKDYDLGALVLVSPQMNIQCRRTIDSYKRCFVSENGDASFVPVELENFMALLRTELDEASFTELKNRYLGVEFQFA